MKTIYKYPLNAVDRQVLNIPFDYEDGFFSVGYDPQNVPCLWCSVDTKSILWSNITVSIVGTGNPRPLNAGKFVGNIKNSKFVWHVFVQIENETHTIN